MDLRIAKNFFIKICDYLFIKKFYFYIVHNVISTALVMVEAPVTRRLLPAQNMKIALLWPDSLFLHSTQGT